MATYTKTLKTLTVTLINGDTVTIADTATNPLGSQALQQFLAFQTIVTEDSGATIYIPFHAVLQISVATSESSDIEKADPYGCADD